jgi:iron complex outermembrane receptor protein
MQHRLTPLAAALALAFIVPVSLAGLAQAQTTSPQDATTTSSADAKSAALPTVTVSADASADGLPEAYAGGQVARGGRVGFLGNKDFLDTPFSTTSYTQEFIKDQQAQGVGDILQSDPTVRVTRGYGNFQEAYVIRGMMLNSDDLAYNGLYGLLPRQYVSSELLERVEVLRGASAFLNGMTPGSSGLGGTINLLPKRATSDPITQVTVGWETGDQGYYAADIGRRFGADDRLGVRVNAVRRKGGTGVDNENRELSLASLGLDYHGNDFRLSADFGFQEQRLIGARSSVALASGVAVPSARSASGNYSQPWTYSNERDQFGTLRGEWDLNANITAWAAYGMRHSVERNSLSGVQVTGANGAAATYRFDNAREDTVNTGEVGIRDKFNTGPVKHELSATASIFQQDTKNAYGMSDVYALSTNIYTPTTYTSAPSFLYTGNDLAHPQTTEHDELSSVAIADTASILDDRLQITLGARNQRVKQTSYAYNTGIQSGDYNGSTTTPMAAIVFKVLKDLSIYGSYVEGLQVGSTVTDTAASNYGQVFAPYKSKQKEVGIKYDAGKVGLTAALFTMSKPNMYKVGNTYGEYGNQRNRGLELTAFGTPMRGVRLLAGLVLLDAKQQSTGSATTDGKYVLGTAKTQGNVGIDVDVPGIQGLSVNARTTYTGSEYVDAANTQETPAWVRYDLGARYVTMLGGKTVTFRGRIDNVTNKAYWASAGGSSGYGYLVLGAPRTFVLSAAIDF